jgi:hypothetical protein
LGSRKTQFQAPEPEAPEPQVQAPLEFLPFAPSGSPRDRPVWVRRAEVMALPAPLERVLRVEAGQPVRASRPEEHRILRSDCPTEDHPSPRIVPVRMEVAPSAVHLRVLLRFAQLPLAVRAGVVGNHQVAARVECWFPAEPDSGELGRRDTGPAFPAEAAPPPPHSAYCIVDTPLPSSKPLKICPKRVPNGQKKA